MLLSAIMFIFAARLLTSLAARMKKTEIPTIEDFKSALRRHSLKATAQRIAVHRAMMGLEHASADMVTKKVEESAGAKVTVASVYNILTQMAEKGIYGRRMSCNGKMYFDVNPKDHAHIYDKEGNEYMNLVDNELMDVIDEYLGRRKFKGYTIVGADIQLIVKPKRKRTAKINR